MTSQRDSTERRERGRPRLRTVLAPLAGLVVIAAIAIPLSSQWGSDKDVDPKPAQHAGAVDLPAPTEASPPAPVAEIGAAVRFGRFPLDLGWAEVYGRNLIDGPDPGAGGISMPEGHCDDEVLFGSGYEDKLSTYVSPAKFSRTREILGYASAADARSAFRALGDAVSRCAVVEDPYSGKAAYSAVVYDAIDEANARRGRTTFTFSYVSPGATPFGVLYQFAVVDDVLFGSSEYGAWSMGKARAGVAALDRENAPVIALLPRIER